MYPKNDFSSLSIDVGPGKTGLAENNLQSKEKCPSFYLSDFLSETSFAFFASGPTSIVPTSSVCNERAHHVGSTRPQRASRAQGVLEWGGGIRQQGDVLSNVENGDQQHAAAVQHPVLRPPMLRRGARERKYADRPRAPLARRRGLVGLGGRPGPLRRSLRKRLRRGRRARLARAARGGRAKLSPTNKKGEIRDLQRRATRTNTEGSSNTLPCTLLVVSVAGSACGTPPPKGGGQGGVRANRGGPQQEKEI
jgi:hypothetical protein